MKLKLYAVVTRKTQSDDDVEIFAKKATAKAYIKAEIQRYIDAYCADIANSGIIGSKVKTVNGVQSYKKANGEAYSVYYGKLDGGDYVYSARLIEKEIL